MSAGFLERTLRGIADTLAQAARAEQLSGGTGWLQSLDPRVKVGGTLLWVVAVVACHRLAVQAAVLAAVAGAAACAGTRVLRVLARMWCAVGIFGAVIVVPAMFTTPGDPLWRMPGTGWHLTSSGLRAALGLLLRAETTASLAGLLVLTTPWPRLLKSLRAVGAPGIAVAILGMTYRYIFLLLQLAGDHFEARRARVIGTLAGPQRRRLAVSAAAALLGRSIQLSTDVHEAMRARGFQGTVRTLDEFRITPRDWVAALFFAAGAAAIFLLGRTT